MLPCVLIAALLLLPTAARAASAPDPIAHGRGIAQAYCAGCHAIGPAGASPRRGAPPFRELHTRYDVENLQEALAEGILTGHPAMPQIRLWPEEIVDFIAYLKTLERPAGAAPARRAP